jgi:ATP-binding protein involved in chromosome partitioning
MQVHFLGALPLDPAVRQGGDTGRPAATRDAGDPGGDAFRELARRLEERIRETGPPTGPSIEISE